MQREILRSFLGLWDYGTDGNLVTKMLYIYKRKLPKTLRNEFYIKDFFSFTHFQAVFSAKSVSFYKYLNSD